MLQWFLGIALLVVVVVGMGIILPFFALWIQARVSGVNVSFIEMIGMKLRGLNPNFILEQAIRLAKADIHVPFDSLEAHMLTGGNLQRVAEAIISASKAGINVDFDQLAAIDLAGRDVFYAVDAIVNPKVLVCPPSGSGRVLGVARDGIRVNATVRVTVRTNLERLVGGANEETVIARVGEGIVAAIGAAASHKEILERPEIISQYILSRGLDSGTSFEIVSVDVADVDVVDNVGARLAEEQAAADTVVAQARAEGRRMMAVALEREMRARVTEMNSQLIAARVVLPSEIAQSCRVGRMWRSRFPVHSTITRQLWNIHDQ